MNSSQLKHVWGAFIKVYDTSITETEHEVDKGLGLSLALSSSVITSMGGEINVDSTPDVGSTFYFNLPVAL